MANGTNVFDFSAQTLAQFLATSVSDGTYADVVQTTKVDQAGEEAAATQIQVAAGQLWSNMTDDFIIAAYPYLRALATGAVPSSRLVETPSPTFGTSGFPTTYTYTLAGDERIAFNDSGLFPGESLAVTLPAIAGLEDGQEVSLRLPFGNPVAAVTLTPDAADTIVDPATGLDVGPAGTALTFSVGTFSSGVTLTWQMVAETPNGRWAFEYDNAGTGGGVGRLDEVLTAGPNTDGNDLFVQATDYIGFANQPAPLGDPSVAPGNDQFGGGVPGRNFLLSAVIAAGTGGVFQTVGVVQTGTGAPNGANNSIYVRVIASRRVNSGTATTVVTATFDQIWELDFGVWALVESVSSSASAGSFRLIQSGADLVLQTTDDAALAVTCWGKIEVLTMFGYPAA